MLLSKLKYTIISQADYTDVNNIARMLLVTTLLYTRKTYFLAFKIVSVDVIIVLLNDTVPYCS